MNDSHLTDKKNASGNGNSASPPNSSMMLSRANMGRVASLLTEEQRREAEGVSCPPFYQINQLLFTKFMTK